LWQAHNRKQEGDVYEKCPAGSLVAQNKATVMAEPEKRGND
jgi:hypothetical protein